MSDVIRRYRRRGFILMKAAGAHDPRGDHDMNGTNPILPRIIAAYRRAIAAYPATSGLWDGFNAMKTEVHEALIKGNASVLQAMLDDPGTNNLLYGFENTARALTITADLSSWLELQAGDLLGRLCAAMGVRKLHNPEPGVPEQKPTPEECIELIDRALGAPVRFPNPYPGEYGVSTRRGVASFRAIQAVYQAWRLSRMPRGRIAEIGGGLGRTAFHVWEMGFRDYTIVDLPLTSVAQAWWLSRALGDSGVCLFGEDRPGIRLVPPSAFLESDERYGVVACIDALIEFPKDVAQAYVRAAEARAAAILLVNHEAGAFCARDLWTQPERVTRGLYWMRNGYVEEEWRR